MFATRDFVCGVSSPLLWDWINFGYHFPAQTAIFMKLHQTLLAALVSILCITPVFSEDIAGIRKKAEQGDATAQLTLARAYYGGKGVPEDKAEALKWYRKAADQGHAQAQAMLGIAYGEGFGVPQDYIQSYMWHNLASAQGEAREVKLELSKKMTKEQIAEAQKLSTQWMERKAKEKKK